MPPKQKDLKGVPATAAEVASDIVGVELQEVVPVETTHEYLALQAELEGVKEAAANAHKHDVEHVESLRKQISDLRSSLDRSNLVNGDLVLKIDALSKAQREGKFDNTIHLAGVPYKIFHQELAKEFMEDIKKRIVPEEAICIALVKKV